MLPFFARFSFGYYLNIVFYIVVFAITIRILLDNRSPTWSLAMLLALYFLPVIGIPLYFLGGVNWKKRKIVKHIPERIFKSNLGDLIQRQQDFLSNVPSEYENDSVKNVRMLLNSSGAILTMDNIMQVYEEGEDLFRDLLEKLEEAERSIHMEYFIWRSDELGEQIREVLTRKAAEGVEVRLLFDGVGCFRMMSRRYKLRLRRAGIQIRYFLDPLSPFSGWLLNYCNHRKIVVVDGQTAFMGGMNIGSEYIDGGKRFDTWRDIHMRFKGESVGLLQAVFLADWENSGGKVEDESVYINTEPDTEGDLAMQIVTSGPDSDWHSLKDLFFNLISNANEEVLIASPYFIIDEAIEEAMVTAALAGVTVRIIMAGPPPDKWVPFWVAQTYYERLIEAGVEFYQYRKGFFHSKYIVADGKVATAGTCNMDLRSLQLHYEINAVIYDAVEAEKFRSIFEENLTDCRKVSLEELENLGFLKKLRNSIFRIIAPLL
ncbi:MAG: cardiolipin synthase [Spirochaetales bacterium]|uniref:Cardiolipin synthase n=1 Tax=Candidatus Thalassospirochaeta sargassi TaxID=3119039 RepID=A0AAJ1MIE6_9SPIO|nr:cardiolipin synthase [Spirochaetales bacterium]